ncbi:C4-dicarboxylate ABC transporter permease [Alloyangia pacifica]|uniref:TRAP transporter large permease protein n=1 Tax=Alloyangia pacifica TaxID=311180 RepID=A0A2U8HKY2_9RHOB|nr:MULTISPECIES: TRAP transporter large permease subunit [Roseobacteraceae]AWI85525.1 C4-dicarboxylate ABC transporter permease [Alloyangia pacifica]NDW33445.1 TRAP transporter large permease subunit [Salipiger sp. PrR007]
MFWTTLIGVMVFCASTGVALGAALGLTGLVLLHVYSNGATSLAVDAIWSVFNSFTLSAVPLFILLGEILLHSGVSNRAYSAFAPLFRRVPGGLLHTNIAVCTLFGAVSGSSMSTAAAVGSVAYPEMVRRGYDKDVIVGSLAGGGTLGLLIPPSLSFLIYGALTETSIGRLFMAGILPGLMIGLMFMGYILVKALRHPQIAPRDESGLPLRDILRGFSQVWPLLILIFAVIGSIIGGIATPTEAAGLGVVLATVISFLWGDLTLRKLLDAIFHSTLLFAAIGFVVLGATILAQSVSILGIPQKILSAVAESGLGQYSILMIVVLIYLLLGCFFDGLSLMIMTLPVVFPLLTGLGYDPIWVGVLITIVIEIGQVTPPVGLNLSVLSSLTKNEISLGRVATATVPYWLIHLFALVVLTIFPVIALYLPNLLF